MEGGTGGRASRGLGFGRPPPSAPAPQLPVPPARPGNRPPRPSGLHSPAARPAAPSRRPLGSRAPRAPALGYPGGRSCRRRRHRARLLLPVFLPLQRPRSLPPSSPPSLLPLAAAATSHPPPPPASRAASRPPTRPRAATAPPRRLRAATSRAPPHRSHRSHLPPSLHAAPPPGLPPPPPSSGLSPRLLPLLPGLPRVRLSSSLHACNSTFLHHRLHSSPPP